MLVQSGGRDAIMVAGFNLRQMKSALESSAVFGSKKPVKEEHDDPLLEDDDSDAGYNDVDVIRQGKTSRADSCVTREKKHWQAPELLDKSSSGPTEASDIYVLGMCVVEAFSAGDICNNGSFLDRDFMPSRPSALADAWQWALVERMCSRHPKDRPSLAEVLASFQVFAEDEEKENTEFSFTKRRKKSRNPSLRQPQSRATSASIACALSEVYAWCDEACESSALNYQLYERMDDLAARLAVMDADGIVSRLPTLASLILRFRDMLQRHVNENPLLRLAATRQIIETNLSSTENSMS